MEGLDDIGFSELEKQLLKFIKDTYPRESKKFLKKEANKLTKKTLAKAKTSVKEDTGNYFKSIKTGKVYKFNGDLSCRTFSSNPVSHLVEFGHRQVTKDGEEIGFVEGKHVFEKASKDFEQEFYGDCKKFLDDMLS